MTAKLAEGEYIDGSHGRLKFIFFFSSRRRHTRSYGDWSSDVCSSDLVRTRAQQVKEAKKQASFTKIIKYFLLSFATIALFVGAFVIFNTLSITVSQRIRSEERRVGKECRYRWWLCL